MVVAALRAATRAGADPAEFAPAFALDAPGRIAVTIDTDDAMSLSGTYAPNGATPGSPAVVLVHGEGQTRLAFAALVGALDEHRVPWVAIDLRGHGRSAEQEGKDVSGLASRKDPAFYAGFVHDVFGAVRWLSEVRKHDPARIGILASGMAGAPALRAAHLHKGEIAALVLLTPTLDQPGFETAADAHDIDGKMDVLIVSSVEDSKRFDKIGPLHLLYSIERDRNAPPDTRREDRVAKRRGIPPRWLAFAETGIFGTKMIEGVAHLDAWFAAWWARRFETLPHAVLFDGSVELKNDYADPGWIGATPVPGAGEVSASALRWGRRLMVGGELPSDVTTVYLRVYATRGDGHTAGQYAQIAYPTGEVSAQALFKSFMGRAPPTETAALVKGPEELPQSDGTLLYGKPSFEAEMRLPDLTGDGPYEVRLSFAVGRGQGPENAPGVDPDKPETWTRLADLLDPTAAAPAPGTAPKDAPPAAPKAPPGEATPRKPR